MLYSRRPVVGIALALTLILSTAVACGQNPGVTAEALKIAGEVGTPLTEQQRQQLQQIEQELPPAPEASPTPTVSPTGVPSAGPTGGPTTTPPPVVINGTNGSNGCPAPTFPKTFAARKLTDAEKASIPPLPYRAIAPTRGRPRPPSIATMNVGDPALNAGGVSYVMNTQTVLAFDVTHLPPLESITGVNAIRLQLKLTKIARDGEGNTRTEILCFVDEKLCSGETFNEAGGYRPTMTPEFWDGGESTHLLNGVFADQYLRQQVGRISGYKLYQAEVELGFDQLLHGSGAMTPLKLLYGEGGTALPRQGVPRRTLKVVIADDTHVSLGDSRLYVDLNENTCLRRDLEAAQAGAQ